jgi:integrase
MEKRSFTAGIVRGFKCPHDKQQAIYWDAKQPGLGLRVTGGGAKAYIFETRLNGNTMRVTIGSLEAWPLNTQWRIDAASGERIEHRRGAREEAARLKGLTDQGKDPRALERKQREEAEAARIRAQAEANRDALRLADVWSIYLDARRKHWSDRHLFDHKNLARRGGEKWKRGKRKTNPGPLASLMPRPLREIDSERLKAWLRDEVAERPGQAQLAFSALRTFANWCADTPEYRGIFDPAIFDTRAVRELLPKKAARKDCLQREQLKPWFSAVLALNNPTASAYLQALLLTGARREELAGLKWANVDFKWQSLTISDKVEGERTIPLTPYVASLLRELQRRNVRPLHLPPGEKWEASTWVFASPTAESGRLQEPRIPHNRALRVAGIDALTLHGLRRSFKTLSEWVEVPVGIVAQIMGHAPSAIAEKHYTVRPLDLLRMWHSKVERWILEQAGIHLDAEQTAASRLHAVEAA